MLSYRAKVKDNSGERKTLEGTAESKEAFIAKLRADGCIVLSIEERRTDVEHDGILAVPFWNPVWLLPMTGFDAELGFQQIASMLKSGVSLLTALLTVSAQSRRPRAAMVWKMMYDRICAGDSFSDAMSVHTKKFGEVAVQLVKVGEHSGELDLALMRAAEQLEARRNIRMMVANALIYPALATLMAVGVSAYLVVAVIPKIAEFLEQGGAELPPMTQILLDVSTWLRLNGLFVAGIAFAICAVVAVIRMSLIGREATDAVVLRLPVVGRIMRLSGTAVFSRAMNMLVGSGITLLDALTVTKKLLANRRLSRRVGEAYDAVLRGTSLASALYAAPEFMPMLPRMAAVGETTGALADAFAETARFHEMMLAITVKQFSVAIEPLVILITGGIVGFVYVSFFMALFSMAGAA